MPPGKASPACFLRAPGEKPHRSIRATESNAHGWDGVRSETSAFRKILSFISLISPAQKPWTSVRIDKGDRPDLDCPNHAAHSSPTHDQRNSLRRADAY